MGILHIRNEENQSLLHLCAIHGSRDCLFYIFNFNIINSNDQDNYGNTAIYYLIKHYTEDTKKNKEMFLWLASISNINILCAEGTINEIMNEWQRKIYEKYVKNAYLKRVTITE